MGKTSIEWTDAVWNPTVGCSVLSPGCTNCYAMRMAGRLEAMGNAIYRGHTIKTKAGHVWNGKVGASNHRQMIAPLPWKKPRRVFVNSMSDLFHEDMPDEVIDQVFAVMALCPQHTFQVLTKRSGRMREYLSDRGAILRWIHAAPPKAANPDVRWRNPLPNVHLGVSVEDRERATRIDDLRGTPAVIRFLSLEPLLDSMEGVRFTGIDQVIVGGESGPGARPNWVPNVRAIVRQCREDGAAPFVKQLGANVRDRNDAGFDGCEPDSWPDMDPFNIEHDLDGISTEYQGAPVRVRLKSRKGGDMDEWPMDLRVRERPHRAMPR